VHWCSHPRFHFRLDQSIVSDNSFSFSYRKFQRQAVSVERRDLFQRHSVQGGVVRLLLQCQRRPLLPLLTQMRDDTCHSSSVCRGLRRGIYCEL
jgi:hypothetical protein